MLQISFRVRVIFSGRVRAWTSRPVYNSDQGNVAVLLWLRSIQFWVWKYILKNTRQFFQHNHVHAHSNLLLQEPNLCSCAYQSNSICKLVWKLQICYIHCITPKRATSLPDPSMRHWARATQHLSTNASGDEPLVILSSIWPARDLNLEPSAPETNAVTIQPTGRFNLKA